MNFNQNRVSYTERSQAHDMLIKPDMDGNRYRALPLILDEYGAST